MLVPKFPRNRRIQLWLFLTIAPQAVAQVFGEITSRNLSVSVVSERITGNDTRILMFSHSDKPITPFRPSLIPAFFPCMIPWFYRVHRIRNFVSFHTLTDFVYLSGTLYVRILVTREFTFFRAWEECMAYACFTGNEYLLILFYFPLFSSLLDNDLTVCNIC